MAGRAALFEKSIIKQGALITMLRRGRAPCRLSVCLSQAIVEVEPPNWSLKLETQADFKVQLELEPHDRDKVFQSAPGPPALFRRGHLPLYSQANCEPIPSSPTCDFEGFLKT